MLPAKAREFIHQYFSDTKVSYIKIDDDLFERKKYEVVLANGTDIDFDKNGEWVEIEGKRTPIPVSILPDTSGNYLRTNFPENVMIQIEKKRDGYEVELNNDFTLEFDSNGRLIKLDD